MESILSTRKLSDVSRDPGQPFEEYYNNKNVPCKISLHTERHANSGKPNYPRRFIFLTNSPFPLQLSLLVLEYFVRYKHMIHRNSNFGQSFSKIILLNYSVYLVKRI